MLVMSEVKEQNLTNCTNACGFLYDVPYVGFWILKTKYLKFYVFFEILVIFNNV